MSGKYSKFPDWYKKELGMFKNPSDPFKVDFFSNAFIKPDTPTLQNKIINKDPALKEYWENLLDKNLSEGAEVMSKI